MNGIIGVTYKVGLTICQSIYIQLLFFAYVLKSIIFLGFFPSLYAMFYVINASMNQGFLTYQEINQLFKEAYESQFKTSNIIGYLLAGLLIFESLDLIISKNFIGQPIVHGALILLLLMTVGTAVFSFPVLIRYDLTPIQIVKQAFLVAMTSLVEGLAILIGLMLLPLLYAISSLLIFIVGFPLSIFVILFFSRQAFIKVEEKVRKYEENS